MTTPNTITTKKTQKREAFIYTWSVEDDTENHKFHIRMYGIDEEEKNVCLHVRDFMPYFYIELSGVTEREMKENEKRIREKLVRLMSDYEHLPEECKKDGKCKYCWKGHMEVCYKMKKLYFHHEHNSFAMIKMSFPNNITRKRAFYKLQDKSIQVGLRTSPSEIRVHENEANPILQFCTIRHIDTTGWVRWDNDSCPPPATSMKRQTHCERELSRHFKDIHPLEDKDKHIPLPYVLSFDIEVYSSVPSRMPDPEVEQDVVFQISMVFSRDQKHFKQYLLSLGKPTTIKNTTTMLFSSERDLLIGFTELIKKEKPNVVVGYNIFGFDMMYMIQRAKQADVMGIFDQMGFRTQDRKGNAAHAPEKQITWSSSAYSHQNFLFLDTEGRLFVDLLPVVRRDFKFENYRLKTISEYFIGQTKDPITPRDIFEGYRLARDDDNHQLLTRVGKYCVQDSRLVLLLFEKLQTWIGLSEMAKTCRVPILTLYTQGQQIKVYSQLYYQCTNDRIVVQSPHSLGPQGKLLEGADHYSGAYVFPPTPGIYDWVVPFDFCLAGDTLVSLPNGTSKRIDRLTRDTMVLGYDDEKKGFSSFSSVNGLQKKGIRETVEVVLQDGQTLVATPDHKIMLENGEWCPAGELKGKKVRCGVEFTEDVVCPLEKDWSLELEGCTLTMKDDVDREKALAFARMVGYVMSDGSIYITKKDNRACVEACFGTMMDAQAFKADMGMFTGVDVTIRKRVRPDSVKGSSVTIAVPAALAKMMHSLDGIVVGKRCTQEMRLPSFVLDENCPLSIVREFLGGLYGGDGTAPFFRAPVNMFGNIEFKWTIVEQHMDSMKKVFDDLLRLVSRFGVRANLSTPIKIKYKEHPDMIRPKDYEKQPRHDYKLVVSMHDATLFRKKIGFRYCINKSCKLSIATSYQRMLHTVCNECVDLSQQTKKLQEQTGHSIATCLDAVKKQQIIEFIHPCVAGISSADVNRILKKKPEDLLRMRFGNRGLIRPSEYIEQIGASRWFDGYAVTQDEEAVPFYTQKVVDVRQHEPVEVFDIEVEDSHNFIAASIVSSNCSLYPSSIIAHNIDFSTLVTDDSVPDEDCHKVEWWDHIGCEHDTTVHAVKPKYVVCQQFSYRFLKKPIGVIPRALMNLLEQRRQTRQQMKVFSKRIKESNDEKEKAMLETMIKVYDKRQLAYKVSANSMYGAMGVKKGYLPFLPGAMSTTAVGRNSIATAADYVKKHFNGQIVYGDSVVGATPLRLRIHGKRVTIISVEDLVRNGEWRPCLHDEEKETCELEGVESWTDQGWTLVERVVRHKLAAHKKIVRVCTPVSIVDATDDHSLLTKQDANPISSKKVETGRTELMHHPMPPPLDAEDEMSEQEASIMGFFLFHGKCGKTPNHKGFWHMDHSQSKTLTHYQWLCKMVFPHYDWQIVNTLQGAFRLLPRYGDMQFLLERFGETSRGLVPETVMNGKEEIRWSFWEGLMEDGGKNKKFMVETQVAAARLQWLASSIGLRMRVDFSEEKFIVAISSLGMEKDHVVRKMVDLDLSDETTYVYDLTTRNHHFSAGIGDMIVHNTDSIYCHFPLPDQKDFAKQLWEHAKKIEDSLLCIFPDPMKLAFEEKLYKKFLILTKKRYMALTTDHTGKDEEKLTIRGVLLARRDNARWVRKTYEFLIRSIMACATFEQLVEKLNEELCGLFRNWRTIPLKQFIVSKTLGKDYAVRPPPEDPLKLKKRLMDLGINEKDAEWRTTYDLKSQPAHAQLAEKMKRRGTVVEPGSRIEYVVVQHPDKSPKLFDRIENPEYLMQHSDLVKIDPVYYAQNLINPADQVLEVCFKQKAVVEKMIKTHTCFQTCMMQLQWRFHPYYFEDAETGKRMVHPDFLAFERSKNKKTKAATKKKKTGSESQKDDDVAVSRIPDVLQIEMELQKKKKKVAADTEKATEDKKKAKAKPTETKAKPKRKKQPSPLDVALDVLSTTTTPAAKPKKTAGITDYFSKKE